MYKSKAKIKLIIIVQIILINYLCIGCNNKNELDLEVVIDRVTEKQNFSSDIDSLTILIKNDSEIENYYVERGFYYLYANQEEKSRLDFEFALSQDENNISAKLGIVDYLQKTGKQKESIKLIEDILNQEPENGIAYYFRAGTYNEIDQGISDLNKCIKLTDNFRSVYFKRGMYNFLQNSLELALDDFSYLIKIKPNVPIYYIMQNSIYEKQKDYSKILENNEILWILEPKYHLSILRENSGIYKELGDYDKMTKCLKKIKEIEKENR